MVDAITAVLAISEGYLFNVAKLQESSGEVLGKDALSIYLQLKSSELTAVCMESLSEQHSARNSLSTQQPVTH